MSLPGPYEFWDLPENTPRKVMITRWEEGTVDIAPKYPGAPETKNIKALRLYLAPGYKDTIPSYWDLTSQHLVAHMRALLIQTDFRGREFEITKIGKPPAARFQVRVIPA